VGAIFGAIEPPYPVTECRELVGVVSEKSVMSWAMVVCPDGDVNT
jgi:hypothetical protein